VQINVKYFASIRESLGLSHETCETLSRTVGDFRDEMITRGEPYASTLSQGKSVRMALNQIMCNESVVLTEGCELAFFPPVTGG
jgi:molybdopterin synthase sulfur carrier subunit